MIPKTNDSSRVPAHAPDHPEALRCEELEQLHDLSGDVFFILDQHGRFVYASRAAVAAFGFEVEALLGRSFLAGLMPTDRAPVEQRLATLGADPVHIDVAHVTNSGAYARFQWTVRRQGDRIQGMARDPGSASAERRPRGQEYGADAAGHAKTEFLASMNHELRTPLNAILGYTELLASQSELSSRQRDALEAITRSSQHLLLLINDILDFAKLDTGKLTLQPRDFSVPAFLRMLTELFESRARQKNLAFTYQEVSPLPQAIRVDETRLRQVLLNLLSNAVKFTSQGSVTLRAGFDQGRLRFEVEDTGIGIQPSQLEAIFHPFEQLPQDRGFVEGTGLGLSISRRLVDLMGGTLEVKSRFGEGSVFSFDIAPPVVELRASLHSDPALVVPPGPLRPPHARARAGTDDPPEAPSATSHGPASERSIFSAEQLRAIHDAATIGDIRTILRVLEEAGFDAGSSDPTTDSLAAEIYALARAFRSRQIKERVKVLLE